MCLIMLFATALGAFGALENPGADLFIDVGLAAVAGGLWWLCGRGRRSARFSRTVETVGPADIVAFGVSRDGTKVAYAADATTDFLYQVFVKDLSDASAPVQVSNVSTLAPSVDEPWGPAASYPLVWSPDGTRIAFLADWNLGGTTTDNQWAAYVVPSTGQGGTRLLELAAIGSDAPNVTPGLRSFAWCPDSATLFLRGAYADATQPELFGITDFATQDQSATAVRLFQPAASDGLVTGLDVVE